MKIAQMTALSVVFCIASLAALADVGKVAAGISVVEGYVRAVPPVMKTSAAFMQLRNSNNSDHALVKAYSDAAKNVELHSHTNDGGVMRMRKVSQIDIPANAVATLQPGGYHVMLIGLNQSLSDGDSVVLGLEFEDGSTQQVRLPVLKHKR